MPQSRAQAKSKCVRRTATRHVYRDKFTVLRDNAHGGIAAVRGTVIDDAGNHAVVPWRVVPESVAAELPTVRASTERYAPMRQAVFLRFRGWKTLTKKSNGKRRVRAILRRVIALLNCPELNNPDNPDRIDNGVFRLLPRRQELLDALLVLVEENSDCLTLSETL